MIFIELEKAGKCECCAEAPATWRDSELGPVCEECFVGGLHAVRALRRVGLVSPEKTEGNGGRGE